MLNIFPRRIFDTHNLLRSSSYQKHGLPTTYLHQVVAVPTNFCIKHHSAAQTFRNKQFCIRVARRPRLAWPRQHLFGCCWEQLLLLTKAGRLCTFKSKFFLHPTPPTLSTLHQLRAERRYRIESARVVQCSMASCTAWIERHYPGPTQPHNHNARFTSTGSMQYSLPEYQ